MVKNLPCNAGDTGSSPGQGTKILHAVKHPSPLATTRESVCIDERACMMQRISSLQQLRPAQPNKQILKKKKTGTSCFSSSSKLLPVTFVFSLRVCMSLHMIALLSSNSLKCFWNLQEVVTNTEIIATL